MPIFLEQSSAEKVFPAGGAGPGAPGRPAHDGNGKPYTYGILSPDAAQALHRHAGTLDMRARK